MSLKELIFLWCDDSVPSVSSLYGRFSVLDSQIANDRVD